LAGADGGIVARNAALGRVVSRTSARAARMILNYGTVATIEAVCGYRTSSTAGVSAGAVATPRSTDDRPGAAASATQARPFERTPAAWP
jgi:hypothetical protein